MAVCYDRLSKLQILKLLQSVNENDVKNVKKLIQHGVPNLVNCTDPIDDGSCLHLATLRNNIPLIMLLLDFGADINVIDKKCSTVYMQAAKFGFAATLKLLLESTTNPNISARDENNDGIVHYCMYPTERHSSCLKIAIQHGADIHLQNKAGKTPLIRACEENLVAVVKSLLEYGADVNCIPQLGETALIVASRLGHKQCVHLLLKYKANPNLSDEKNKTAAHMAALKDHLSILRILSAYQADFNLTCLYNNTPMHDSASQGHHVVCKFLAQRGCFTKTKNKDGMTAKTLAKDAGHKLAVKECKKAEKIKRAKAGSQVYIIKFYDWVIDRAPDIKSLVCEHRLKEGNVSINSFIDMLETLEPPLEQNVLEPIIRKHSVLHCDNVDVELFLSGKKIVNKAFLVGSEKKKKKGGRSIKARKGKTKVVMPICTNEIKKRSKRCGPLSDYVEKCEPITDYSRFNREDFPDNAIEDDTYWYMFQPAPRYVHIGAVIKSDDCLSLRAAIKKGFDVNSVDKYFKTPLMMAAICGNVNVARILIEHGANVHSCDNFRWTPLHFACHVGCQVLVDLFIEHGSRINAQSLNGGTPLMRAVEASRLDIVKTLLAKGANVTMTNKIGQSAVDIAISYGDVRIVHVLHAASKSPCLDRLNDEPPPTLPSSPVAQFDKLIENPPAPIYRCNGIGFFPKKAWSPITPKSQLLKSRQSRRECLGDEIDFREYKPPFVKFANKIAVAMDDRQS